MTGRYRQLARLWTTVDDEGLLDRSIVAVTADHGEAMGEEGFYFAHSHSVGLDQVHVPLILAAPGLPRGAAVARPVTNVWLFSTVLELLGVTPPAGIEGPSLASLVRDPSAERPPFFVESLSQSGVVDGNLFLRRDRRPAADAAFWRAGNPNSRGFWKPLGRSVGRLGGDRPEPADAAAAESWLDRFERRARASRSELAAARVRSPDNPERREALRALGYLR